MKQKPNPWEVSSVLPGAEGAAVGSRPPPGRLGCVHTGRWEALASALPTCRRVSFRRSLPSRRAVALCRVSGPADTRPQPVRACWRVFPATSTSNSEEELCDLLGRFLLLFEVSKQSKKSLLKFGETFPEGPTRGAAGVCSWSALLLGGLLLP